MMSEKDGDSVSMGRISEWYISRYNENPVFTLFLTGMFLMLAISVICGLVTEGVTLRNMLHHSDSYILMDHFSITVTCYDHPYTNGDFNIYPPLIVLMYAVVAHFSVPYVTPGADNWQTAMAMRSSEMPVMVLVMLIMAILFFTYVMYQKYTQKEFTSDRFNVLFFTILFSYPVLWDLSVGNCVGLAAFFASMYVFCYDSENKWVRYAAYICLGLAAGIKIIPAFLGILTLKHRGAKEFVICVIITTFLLLGPFVLTDGNPIEILQRSMEYSVMVPSTFGILNINDLTRLLGIEWMATYLKLLLAGLVLLVVLFDDKMERWVEVTLISSLLVIAFSVSVPYLFLYMITGMVMFLVARKDLTKGTMLAVICFVIMFCDIPGFYNEQTYIGTIKAAAVLILVVYLLGDSIKNHLLVKENRRQIDRKSKKAKS